MVSFDLYFAGSQCKEADNLIITSGACRLFSYVNDKSNIKKYLEDTNFKSKLIVDSGAFTAWSQDIVIDVDTYIEWLNSITAQLHLFGQLDDIPGTRIRKATHNEIIQSANKTWENYLYMYSKLKQPSKLLYTFHIGEPYYFLEQALVWRGPQGESIKNIAFGGMVGQSKKTRDDFLYHCYDIISKSNNKTVNTHAFGMTDFDLIRKYPITSADSTSWIMTGANGGIMTDYGVITVSEQSKFEKSYFKNQPLQTQQFLENYVKDYGFTLQELCTEYKQRMCFNVTYLYNKSCNIKRNSSALKRRSLI